MNTTLDWEVVGEVAAALGVKPRTLEKWRERRAVPGKWHIRIIRASNGRLSVDDFEEGAQV